VATYYVATDGDESTGDGSIGNPWATPGYAVGAASSGDTLYIKSGTYTCTTDTPNVSGGILSLGTKVLYIQGYDTTPGDFGTAPIIDASGLPGSFTILITDFGNAGLFANLTVVGNSTCNGISSSNRLTCLKCSAIDCSDGFAGGLQPCSCYAESCVRGFYQLQTDRCTARECTSGFVGGGCTGGLAIECGTGFAVGYYTATSNCTSVNCTGYAFDVSYYCRAVNCLAVGGTYSYHLPTNTYSAMLMNCASFGASGGRRSHTCTDILPIVLSANPFVSSTDSRLDPAGADYASLAGMSLALPQQTDARDIGAVQHTDPAGGFGGLLLPGLGRFGVQEH
jgi:hypothetical protein